MAENNWEWCVMPEKLRLLAYQAAVPETLSAAARDAHVRRMAFELDRALSRKPADLAVLPELATLEYSRAAFERLSELAEESEGPSFQTFSEVMRRHGACLSYGYVRRDGEVFRISQNVVGPKGQLLGTYDKLHLAQSGASMEKEYFTPGEGLFVFSLEGIRIAPVICYDIRFAPLFIQLCRSQEVCLLLHSGAYFRDETFASWPNFAITRAMENQVYVMSLNRAGEEYGESLFVPPWVDETNTPGRFGRGEELRYFVVDRTYLQEIRRAFGFRQDLRDDYGDLAVTSVTVEGC